MSAIIQLHDAPTATTPEGGERRVLANGGGLMLVQFSFDGGVTTNLHQHPHEQVGYVVSGEIDVVMEGREPVRLTAGGSYYVAPNLPHYVVTHAPTVLVDCFTPRREDFLP
jgi:quercetin dioxygenase-like cupin family protein